MQKLNRQDAEDIAEQLDARQKAKCQRLEIDLAHDPLAQRDGQKLDRTVETSQ